MCEPSFKFLSKDFGHGAIQKEIKGRVASEKEMREEADDKNPQWHAMASVEVILFFLRECQCLMEIQKIARQLAYEK